MQLQQTALDFLQQDPDRVLSVTYNQDMRSAELLEMTSKVRYLRRFFLFGVTHLV